ncbi:hypothetical protein A5785_20490 [Gordonia sp. 852002-50395_SCH5434458]|nr:hypothetical protein A5785_20490 [Gordonia sp. 852002-50395_SCH5434458]
MARGLQVCAVDLDETSVKELGGELGDDCLPVAADVSSADGVEAYVHATLGRFGHIDYLHNNAGVEGRATSIDNSDPAEFAV